MDETITSRDPDEGEQGAPGRRPQERSCLGIILEGTWVCPAGSPTPDSLQQEIELVYRRPGLSWGLLWEPQASVGIGGEKAIGVAE
jgi:hypothetical protein